MNSYSEIAGLSLLGEGRSKQGGSRDVRFGGRGSNYQVKTCDDEISAATSAPQFVRDVYGIDKVRLLIRFDLPCYGVRKNKTAITLKVYLFVTGGQFPLRT